MATTKSKKKSKIKAEFGLFKSEFGHLDIADSLTRGKDVCLGLLIHECWHVCEQIFRLMGEDRPSSEFTAYTLQAVF